MITPSTLHIIRVSLYTLQDLVNSNIITNFVFHYKNILYVKG
jgi:hypothetical protein